MMSQMRQHGQTAGHGRRHGFTLIELVVTVAVMSVIMLGVGSAMIIVGHAVPTADSPAAAVIAAGQVADRIATELTYAVTVIDSNATTIAFTVADRDGDAVPETIRYEWSGTPGDSLTRQYNSGTIAEILPSVKQFDLAYELETISVETTPENESAETVLSEYSSVEVAYNPALAADLWCGQYILPSLPADTISWKVTRIAFYAGKSGKSDGEVSVEMQLPTGAGVPSGTALETNPLLESTLPAGLGRVEYSLSNVSGLSPDQGICLVFRHVAGSGTACLLQGQNQNNTPEYGNLVESTDQGGSWSSYPNQTLVYTIYGTVTTPGAPQIEETNYVRAVRIELRSGADDQSTVRTSAHTLNRPEVVQ